MKYGTRTLTISIAIAIVFTIGWNFYWKSQKQDSIRQIKEALRDYEGSQRTNADASSTCSGIWEFKRGVQTTCLVIRESNTIISGYLFTVPYEKGFSGAISGYKKGPSIEIQCGTFYEFSGVFDNEYRQVIMQFQHNISATQDINIIRGQNKMISSSYATIGGIEDLDGPDTNTILFVAQRINQFPDPLLSNPEVLDVLRQHNLLDVINTK